MHTTTTFSLLLATAALSGCAVVPSTGTPTSSATPAPARSPTLWSQINPKALERPADPQTLQTCPYGIRYIPVPPIPVSNYTVFARVPNTERWESQTLPWPVKAGTEEVDAEKVNKLLPNISSNIADLRHSMAGDFTVFNANTQQRHYVFDFTKWRAEQIEAGGHTVGLVRLGAGLRVTVRLNAKHGWAGGSLLNLAASLKGERVEGSIETELIGIDAPDITMAFPFTTDLSESNIQRILESLGVLKAKLYNDKTAIVPHMLAKIECAVGVEKKQ